MYISQVQNIVERFKIQYMQTHLTYINSIFEYCHASVNLDNVVFLEYGNVYRRVLKNKPQLCFFSKKLFLVIIIIIIASTAFITKK